MKKKKRIILGSAIAFIAIVCLEVVNTGHGHVVVVEENVNLTNENKALTNENKGLKTSVANLEAKNEELVQDKADMQQMVSQVIGDLDSTKSVVKLIKKELTDEKNTNARMSSGDEFDFQPIKLPLEDGNQR
jgi:FtsZ-binding cell division protein ZapB